MADDTKELKEKLQWLREVKIKCIYVDAMIEKIVGKPLDEKVIEKISSIFFSLLIILMILIVLNDITLLVKG